MPSIEDKAPKTVSDPLCPRGCDPRNFSPSKMLTAGRDQCVLLSLALVTEQVSQNYCAHPLTTHGSFWLARGHTNPYPDLGLRSTERGGGREGGRKDGRKKGRKRNSPWRKSVLWGLYQSYFRCFLRLLSVGFRKPVMSSSP